jgi:hypothetical protein
MIHPDSLSLEWIQSVGTRLGKVDKALLEKAIRALFLAEQLKVRGLDFQFKGGTSLLLHLTTTRRFSIDVDIVTTASREQLINILSAIANDKLFSRWDEDVRVQQRPDLPFEHFKLFYKSAFPGFTEENYILLDVIYHQKLPTWAELKPATHAWLKIENEPTLLTLSTKEGLLGDKLTAFAPTTTGILYSKNRPLEIIKQLYDIGTLFDQVDDLKIVKSVFEQVASQEISFRKITIGPSEVLNDAFNAALTICDRDEKEPSFQHLKTGITNIKPHIFHRFIIDDAIVAASKVMYLTMLIRKDNGGPPERFNRAQEVLGWGIPSTDFNRFNRFKRTNPEAFFYIFKSYQLIIS